MNNLQGGVSQQAGGDVQQGTSPSGLSSPSSDVQGISGNTPNLTDIAPHALVVVPSCTTDCALGATTSLPPAAAATTPANNSNWLAGGILVVMVVIVALFARKVLTS